MQLVVPVVYPSLWTPNEMDYFTNNVKNRLLDVFNPNTFIVVFSSQTYTSMIDKMLCFIIKIGL